MQRNARARYGVSSIVVDKQGGTEQGREFNIIKNQSPSYLGCKLCQVLSALTAMQFPTSRQLNRCCLAWCRKLTTSYHPPRLPKKHANSSVPFGVGEERGANARH